jgi:hypothetical protein
MAAPSPVASTTADAASPVASTTGGLVCSGEPGQILWSKNYDDPSTMRAEVPALARSPELVSGTQTILVVYVGTPIDEASAPSLDGSFGPLGTSAPGHREICIYNNRRVSYYRDVAVPDRAP